MPKHVDHDSRRRQIGAFALDLIRREGLESATLRRIAQEGGFSMGVLTHYFRSKDQMIGFVFRSVAQQTFAELDAIQAARPPGVARLEALLEHICPTPGIPTNFALWVSLWERALRNPALAREHRAYYARWRGYIERSLSEACSLGQIEPHLDIPRATDLIVASLEGLWIYSIMDPRRFSAVRLRDLLAELTRALLPRKLGSAARGSPPRRSRAPGAPSARQVR